MLVGRTCRGDGACTGGAIVVVDTSHLALLARSARSLAANDAAISTVFFRLVRTSGCWVEKGLVTAREVFDDEIDPHGHRSAVLAALECGLVDPDEDWSQQIDFVEPSRADELTKRASALHKGRKNHRDAVLIGHAIAEADTRPVVLVTNDEDMLSVAQILQHDLRTAGHAPPLGSFLAISSPEMIHRLLRCGAIDVATADTILLAELGHLRTREMDDQDKQEDKVKRIEDLLVRVTLFHLDIDDPAEDVLDARTAFASFPDKVDDDGS